MTNRLIDEQSPYLQQHAHNPVEWYPWCDEVFEKAKNEEKPIFLSIGYSSCHWCHVMEREVFENEELAGALNRDFYAIKVDREERPDIDKFFQDVHQRLNKKGGGWPLSIFLTHLGKPFFAATYIPPKPKYGMYGFGELLEIINSKYDANREEIIESSNEIAKTPIYIPKDQTLPHSEAIIDKLSEAAAELVDLQDGGFHGAPKFPHSSVLELFLDLYLLSSDEEWLKYTLVSLKNMAKGGFWDIVDGGFCRYSVDDVWLVPHFEKMLYDNALLSHLYFRAYTITLDRFYLDISKKCVDFMVEKMSQNGLFFSASDADSEGVEGKYFVYSYSSALEALIESGFELEEASTTLKTLGFSKIGNFEHENIVRNESFAESPQISKVLDVLKNMRKSRIYPFIDKKIITAWNSMMIKSLFALGREDEKYLRVAKESLESLHKSMIGRGKLYHSALIGHEPLIEGFLEDFACYAGALIEGYKSTLDSEYLISAQRVVDEAIEKFFVNGVWFFSFGEFNTVAEAQDTSYPSSIGELISSLVALGHLVDEKYIELAKKSLARFNKELEAYPIYTAQMSRAFLALERARVIHFPKELSGEAIKILNKRAYLLPKIHEDKKILICSLSACEESFDSFDKI